MISILAQIAILATFIGAGLAIASYFNGKHIKESASQIRILIKETQNLIQENHKETQEIIQEMQRETREMFERMDARAEKRHIEVIQLFQKAA